MCDPARPGWSEYFDRCFDLELNSESFRVYSSGCLSSSTADYATEAIYVLFHGGGHSSLSWALVANKLRKAHLGVIAFDFRGHGLTQAEGEIPRQTLVNDAVAILRNLLLEHGNGNFKIPIVLAGHSLGGAVAVHVALSGNIPGLAGLVVVDVVEGSAIASLPLMPTLINQWPKQFNSIEEAIEWSTSKGFLKNQESAKISIPPQLKLCENSGKYIWRTDLLSTQTHWENWYRDLSNAFLSVKCAKMLIVAGRDRMDNALTIAQMQGKFQFVLLPKSGHCIQEDDPDQVAELLIKFIHRNQFAKLAKLNSKIQ